MEEEEEGYQGLKEEQQEIEKQILEVQQNKENTLQELKDSEALEEKTQEEIGKLQEELKIERSKESEASQKVTEWELRTEKLLQIPGLPPGEYRPCGRRDGEEQGRACRD